MLIQATDGVETKTLFASDDELQEAAQQALGNKEYVLVGTTDFLTTEETLEPPSTRAIYEAGRRERNRTTA